MLRILFLPILLVFCLSDSLAQPIQELKANGKISLRGLSVVNDRVVWVSGSKGTVGKSMDGGKSWKWMTVKGYKQCDFRDIEAFDENTAFVMAVASPAFILKTTDGGKHWKKVYENNGKDMFLDAMEFVDRNSGMVVGDPVAGNFFLAKTSNGGESWEELFPAAYAKADSAEACFASSGTNIRLINSNPAGFLFVSGGISSNLNTGKIILQAMADHSRTFSNLMVLNKKEKIPLVNGKNSTGANSIAVKDSMTFIVVGGDFTNDGASPNCALTTDGGKTWTLPAAPPTGYKSCVEYLYGNVWVCCGLTGIDVSNDNGLTWKQISKESYHTCRKAKNGNAVYFSGNKSHIGKFATRER